MTAPIGRRPPAPVTPRADNANPAPTGGRPRPVLPDVSPRAAPVDGMDPPREPAELQRLLQANGLSPAAPLRTALLPTPPTEPCRPDELMVAHYSLENLFDTVDDPATADEEFTPQAEIVYDEAKLAQRITNLGQAIRTMNGGRGPDVLSLTEVENREVLTRLRDEGLGDLGYRTIAHVPDTDSRGIEPALLSRFPMVGEPVLHPVVDETGKKMRGILEVNLDVQGRTLTVLVNHWLSSRAGDNRPRADARRTFAARVLESIVEGKLAQNPEAEVVMLGDFNEGLNGPALSSITAESADAARASGKVFNTIDALEVQKQAAAAEGADVQLGTHYYAPSGHWSHFDHALISHTLLDGVGLAWVPGSTAVYAPDALRTETGAPRRYFLPTFSGDPKQVDLSGLSDHFPVAMRLRVVGADRRPSPPQP